MSRVRAATICLMFAWTLLHSDIRAQPLYFSVDSSADNNPAPEFLPEFWLFDKETEDIIYAGQFSRSANTSSGPVVTSARAMGSFSRGTTAQGTPLPPHNQNLHGNAVYAGGIGIATGICLSTGASSDTDVVGSTLGPGRGVGAEGPNNGAFGPNEGEAGVETLGEFIIDQDDYHLWYNNFGASGNADLAADFNRDGCVDEDDLDCLLFRNDALRVALRGRCHRKRLGRCG